MKYVAQVNDKEYTIEIGQEGELLVNGEPYDVDFRQMPDSGVVSLLINQRSLEAVVEQSNGYWDVLINGELYEVALEDERTIRLAQARGTATAVAGDATVDSPMPGIIIKVLVAEGDHVEKGDKVVILESMKMENELRAPRSGRVTSVSVEAGASVEKNQALVTIGDA